MSSFRDRIFRGCTRPATAVGVPLVPFLLTTVCFTLVAVWTFYLISGYLALFLLMAYLPVLITMREITKKDDQRLRQMMLRLRMRWRQRRTRHLWGAISYSPLRYKRR